MKSLPEFLRQRKFSVLDKTCLFYMHSQNATWFVLRKSIRGSRRIAAIAHKVVPSMQRFVYNSILRTSLYGHFCCGAVAPTSTLVRRRKPEGSSHRVILRARSPACPRVERPCLCAVSSPASSLIARGKPPTEIASSAGVMHARARSHTNTRTLSLSEKRKLPESVIDFSAA